ncbi:MAG: NYN domain-containing protein [Planctomycetota bacterium]|nr:NYN domain-containing protein [Planctomycetota bacterium]MDA1179526.1 NYN domain-containing protein [Planctomycetota bacterium]
MNRRSKPEHVRLPERPQTRILIDGYNLLFAIGFGNIGSPSGVLLSAREELLNFLRRILDTSMRQATVVVFDAKRARYGAASAYELDGMTILFAVEYRDADELLKQIIRGHTTPRKLTVVSSDHSIQVAAQRRRAKAIDSETWYEQACRQANASSSSDAHHEEAETGTRTGKSTRRTTGRPNPTDDDRAKSLDLPAFENPFPPNYGQDVAAEFDLSNPFPAGYAQEVNEQNVDDKSKRTKRKKK